VSGEHQKPRRYEVPAPPGGASKPATRDDPGAFGAEIVAALGHLAEVINQRLQLGPFRSEQCFAVEF
jgi:hypothetical protein